MKPNDDNRPPNENSHLNTDIKSKESYKSHTISTTDVDLNEVNLQEPKCITIQPSFAANSFMPRVPKKATLITLNNQDDTDIKSFHNDDRQTSKYIITTDEQFEDIHMREKRQTENTALLKVKFFLSVLFKSKFFDLISETRLFTVVNHRIGFIIRRNQIILQIYLDLIYLLFTVMINIRRLDKHFFLVFIVVLNLIY